MVARERFWCNVSHSVTTYTIWLIPFGFVKAMNNSPILSVELSIIHRFYNRSWYYAAPVGRQPICVVLNEASRFDSGGNVNKKRRFLLSSPRKRLIEHLPGIYIRILFVVYARILRQNSEGGYI